jgi:hypothetical protein
LKVANEENVVMWKDIVTEMAELIQQNYKGGRVKTFRGDWKRRIKSVVKSMGYKLVESGSDFFVTLNSTKFKKSSGSKSTDSNYTLAVVEKERVLYMYNNIPHDQKWTLSTGKVVDDEMKKLVEKSIYEHPIHSMIFDPDDIIWKNYFTPAELNEIKSFHLRPLPSIPVNIKQYLDTYNKDWNSAKDLYMFANGQVHDPISEFNHKWIRESIIRVSELFLYEDVLDLNSYSEVELLHEVWLFVYRIFKEKGIKARLGEKCSVAVALARNVDRSLEVVERRHRKITGSRVDILFNIVDDELGSCEVGKDRIMVADDKYLNDGLVKLPKTLRDILSALVQKNPAQVSNLASVGFLMMGKQKILQYIGAFNNATF